MMLNLNEENFQKTITENETVIIDFWAPWCGPCRSFAPVFEKVAAENKDVMFAKLNTEEEQRLASAMGIMSIPTLMAFRNGTLVFNQPGAMNATMFQKLVDKVKTFDVEAAKAAGDAQ